MKLINSDKTAPALMAGNQTDGEHRPSLSSSVKGKGGLFHVISATRYSFLGVKAAWMFETAFRQEIVIGAVLLLLVPWLSPSLLFGVLMSASILLVLCVELINSAIEALADAISTEFHPLIGRAKDLGSAAVLFSLLVAVVIWGAALITWLRN